MVSGNPPGLATDPDEMPPLPYDRRIARRAAWVRVIMGSCAVVGAVVIGYLVALPEFSLCTFQTLFGRPCPGCGMTRSIAHLVRGDVLASLRLHPLGLPLFVGTVLALVGGVLHLTRGRDPFWAWVERRSTWLAVGFLVSMIGIWIVRGYIVPEWSPDPVGQPTPLLLPFPATR